MDVTQRYSIAFRGLGAGVHDFRFEVDEALFEAFGSTEIKNGACGVDVRLERMESQMAIDVSIHGSVVVVCDRCLEDCDVPVDFEGRLMVKFSDEALEYDGEVLWLLPCENEVDLSQYIYESIVLSLPYRRVHPEGECDPAMLERFRIVSDEEFAAIEAQAAQEHAGGQWDKLSELRERMQAEEPEEDPSER